MRHNKKTKLVIVWGLFSLVIFLGGCQDVDPEKGYTSASLYRTDIKTVFVPIFKSRLFTRQVEYKLTRAICQRLELQSPYKVVSDRSSADTILYGRLTRLSERVLDQQRELDRPLESQVVLQATIDWKDLRNGKMLIDHQSFQISGDYDVLLAAGRTSAVDQAVNELALRIVENMEKPW